MSTAYANQGSTTLLQLLQGTCLFPKVLYDPEKEYTIPLWALSLYHLASCHNSALDKELCFFVVASFSV